MSAPLKAGDVVVCVSVEPPPGIPGSRVARRLLEVGEIYEVTHGEGGPFGSVRVDRPILCCRAHGDWLPTELRDVGWIAARFEKVGSIR